MAVSVDERSVSASQLSAKVAQYLCRDDVFCRSFLENVILFSGTGLPQASELEGQLRREWGMKSFLNIKANSHLVEGLFFLSQHGLHSAWRLYSDPLDCFFESVIALEDDGSW